MGKLFEIKGYLLKFYGKNSKYVDKTCQFILALLTFTFISNQIGFSDFITNPIVTVALSVICTFLPMTVTVLIATIVTIFQLYTLSLGIAVVALIMFLIMYVLYLRFTPKKAIVLLLVPLAFMLQIPVAIPIIFGLIGGPVYIIPITMGTIIYYMINCVNSYSTLLETVSETGMLGQMTTYTQQLLGNREMWCVIIAFALCLLLVYSLRTMELDHAWEIAIIAGALVHMVAMTSGYVILDVQFSFVSLVIGSLFAIVIAFVLEFFVFTVDYTRTEYLQFEDDEYYYYVKALPKVSVTIPEKTVKRINERQKTGVIDAEQVKELERLAKEEAEESEIQRIIEEELRN